MEKEKEIVETKYKEAERESDQLKKEVEKLRVASKAHKKELEEVRVGFTTKKEMLTVDYQKQVHEMFFFSYRSCMRKNSIIRILRTTLLTMKKMMRQAVAPPKEIRIWMLLVPPMGSDLYFCLFSSSILTCLDCKDIIYLSIYTHLILSVFFSLKLLSICSIH